MSTITINDKEYKVRAHTLEEDIAEAERLVLMYKVYDPDTGLYCQRVGGRIAGCKEFCAYLLDADDVDFAGMTTEEFYASYKVNDIMNQLRGNEEYSKLSGLMDDVDIMIMDYNRHMYSAGYQLKRIGDALEEINTSADDLLDAKELGNILAEAGVGKQNKNVRPINGPFNFSKVKK